MIPVAAPAAPFRYYSSSAVQYRTSNRNVPDIPPVAEFKLWSIEGPLLFCCAVWTQRHLLNPLFSIRNTVVQYAVIVLRAVHPSVSG